MTTPAETPLAIAAQQSNRAVYFWAAVLLLCVGILVWLMTRPNPQPPSLPEPPPPPTLTPSALPQAAFFDEEVQPAIAKADVANRQAAERCIARLQGAFERHRGNVPEFIDDLTSWRTRFGIIRRMPADWWYSQDGLQQYTEQKFVKHLFSEDSLASEIEAALAIYRDELQANSAALLSDVKAAVSESDLPELAEVEYGGFSEEVLAKLKAYSTTIGQRSASHLVLTELASGVGGVAAAKLVAAVVASRIAVMAATSAAAGGGATASGAAAGGGGGTLGGPAGTLVGAAAGLVIGIGIDWWMTSRFRAEMTEQLNELIDGIEISLIQGTGEQQGLHVGLMESCDHMRDAYRETLHRRLGLEVL